jgi:hypothetical protein
MFLATRNQEITLMGGLAVVFQRAERLAEFVKGYTPKDTLNGISLNNVEMQRLEEHCDALLDGAYAIKKTIKEMRDQKGE